MLFRSQEIISDELVISAIRKEVDRVNANLGNWEQIKKFELLSNLFSIEGNELTPTLKLKRKVILGKYQSQFDKIYSE